MRGLLQKVSDLLLDPRLNLSSLKSIRITKGVGDKKTITVKLLKTDIL